MEGMDQKGVYQTFRTFYLHQRYATLLYIRTPRGHVRLGNVVTDALFRCIMDGTYSAGMATNYG